MGKRLGELTKFNTKCMIEVNGLTLIDRMLSNLSGLGLSRVVIVVGYERERLVNYIGHRYDDRLKIEYVVNPIYDRTNNIYSLALAKSQLQEDDTLLLESDLIFEQRMLHLLLDNSYPNLALVAKYETWMDGTMVRIDNDNRIVSFVPKNTFKYSDVPYYYKTCNIYKFSREYCADQYVPFLEAYCKAMGNNEYYEQVLESTGRFELEKKYYPVHDGDSEKIRELIGEEAANEHLEWCKSHDIKATPTIFVNGRLLNDSYNIANLLYI